MPFDPVSAVLSIPFSIFTNFATGKIEKIIKRNSKKMQDLLYEAFIDAVRCHENKIGFKDFGKSVDKDRLPDLFAIDGVEDTTTFLNRFDNEEYRTEVSTRIEKEFSLGENFRDVLILIIADSLKSYKKVFSENLNQEEGIKFLIEQQFIDAANLEEINVLLKDTATKNDIVDLKEYIRCLVEGVRIPEPEEVPGPIPKTIGMIKASALIPGGAEDRDWIYYINKACNDAAAVIYKERVAGETADIESLSLWKDTTADTDCISMWKDKVWGDIWGGDEFTAQAFYIKVRLEETGEFFKERTWKVLTDKFDRKDRARIWVTGNAGTGKTTALYHLYFNLINPHDDGTRPLPFLIQPKELDENSVKRLREAGSKNEFLQVIIDTWLQKRHIDTTGCDASKMLDSFLHHLEEGKFCLLVDSYDELSRMDIQVELFKNLFDKARYYVCASRPESYIEKPENITIGIMEYWDLPSIEKYICKWNLESENELEAKSIKEEIINLIKRDKSLGGQSLKWYRNPRYLNMFLKVLNNKLCSRDSKAIKELLGFSDYQLIRNILSRIHDEIKSRAEVRGHPPVDDSFKEKIEKWFLDIAVDQVNYGGHSPDEEKKDDYWALLTTTSSILKYNKNRQELSFWNLDIVSFLIAESLALKINKDSYRCEFPHFWSDNLVSFLSHRLLKLYPGRQNEKALFKILFGMIKKYRESGCQGKQGGNERFLAVNCLRLVVRLKKFIEFKEDTAAARNTPILLKYKYLNDLYLDNINLSGIRFVDCDFSGSVLSNANLERAKFEDCDFSGASLKCARASFAEFKDCTFDFFKTHGENQGPVKGMVIQGAEFKGGSVSEKEFVEHGALLMQSRYNSPFGKHFFKKQKTFLGDELEYAKEYYLDSIKEQLHRFPLKKPVHLIDLMAGGSRLMELFRTHGGLKILAIDRDTSQIKEVAEEEDIGERITPCQEEIGKDPAHKLKLKKLSRGHDFHPVNLIIAKKALHELPREQQEKLLCECSETLCKNGRLILYADSPVEISENGFDRLVELQNLIRADESLEINELRKRLLDDLSFEGSADDCAAFINLWILLKDWANSNIHEVKNRYFSSANQITMWAEKAGFKSVNAPERMVSRLNYAIFNESGINKVYNLLPGAKDEIDDNTLASLKDILKGGGNEKFKLLESFSHKHLGSDEGDQWEPTPLGKALNASIEEVESIGAIDKRLGEINLTGIAFDLPVHIFVFEKPAGKT